MSEYQMPKGDDAKRFDRLDAFTQGFVTAMFWTECNSDEPELEHKTFSDLSQAALSRIKQDCSRFQRHNASMLALAYESSAYDAERAGVDYWLTRNGHGAGFWDRDELTSITVGARNETNVGDVLANRCRGQSVDLYAGDDGKLYLM